MLFQSTRPVWGATLLDMHQGSLCVVSIHAPRVGRDKEEFRFDVKRRSFNPRAPCGARRIPCTREERALLFQSTRPVWGATHGQMVASLWFGVSIHAPRVGRDNGMHLKTMNIFVSIHAPRVGRDSRTVSIRWS